MADSEKDLRVAVVGAGNMGHNHARGYFGLKNVELAGVYDTDQDAATAVARQYECRVFTSLEEIVDEVDAVSICSPSIAHVEHGQYFLERGISCLIEKPLAITEEGCRSLITAAENSDVTLMVGHIERFNPAVQALDRILKSGNHSIYAINASRMSRTSNRISDVNVVLDLMIHDLDIVMSLVGEKPATVVANSTCEQPTDIADYVNALLTFESGCIANLAASRITHNKIRKLNVSADFGFIELDYINQDIHIYRQDSEVRIGPDNTYALDIASERVLVRRAEPLVLELQNFIDTLRGKAEPLVTGIDGLAAVRLVKQIQKQIGVAG